MAESDSLLATLAQSSAAIVAIVGGFLVSRLVQLSSEREGLRRQLQHTGDELTQVTRDYDEAHQYRLGNSEHTFFGWVIEDLAGADLDTLDRVALLADNIPRGSSEEEMRPYLDAVVLNVETARKRAAEYIESDDTASLRLSDLRDRGLVVSDGEEDLYEHVVDAIAARLPARRNYLGSVDSLLRSSMISDPVGRSTDLRRLDESIRGEQDLWSRKLTLEAVRDRLTLELDRIGRPVGVVSAIVILSIYSLLGIVTPVVVMATGVDPLAAWAHWLLVALFIAGLFAVLGYIYWYARTLSAPTGASEVNSSAPPEERP